ncbi:pyridoxal kinase PdxY [Chelativorans sp. Marseille-P2723]|uniref:pyridoxal kinase PdxY n=1 Tax=Chelativorans sp. Marseille-P2723 TaxID=2709133 RepID=UPI00156EDF59|nr:pyridoxal kinase PdxY [Chelativorans sp. Marseille-P2723]
MTVRNEVANGRRAVIVVSSHVARGSVGNRASVFVLETLGHPVWAVPTVILPWHPGHGRATRIVPSAADFASFMHDLEEAPWLGEVGAVLSGYLGDATQAAAVASLVRRVKRQNKDALYVCDPIIGDIGGLYVPKETAIAIRDELMPLADVATPNRYELAWMTGKPLDNVEAVAEAAIDATPPTMLVTSSPGSRPDWIANLLLTPNAAYIAEHPSIDNATKGPGDLSAALLTAWMLRRAPPEEILRRITASVYEALVRAVARGADELMLEADIASITEPTAEARVVRLPRSIAGGLHR